MSASMLFFLTTTFLMLGSAVAAVADGSFKKMPEISLRQWAVVALSAACVGTTVGLLFYVSSRKDGAMAVVAPFYNAARILFEAMVGACPLFSSS